MNHDPESKPPVMSVCPSCGRPATRCSECGKKFYPQRIDALTCSDHCRMARSRRFRDMKARGKAVES